ncbi:BLOC-1-related complex subunit 6 isoform X2 [Atheta coriaria]|uniref:BLOC-1-related complex subunit 6 isoform X2 n=1 Tax=Dalotia coriaria TaxID=877792 RepID=UPI0031F339F8
MDSDSSLPSPPGPPKEPPPSLPPPLPARPRKTSPQPPIPQHHYDIDQEVDNDDEISAQMTASYSEISFKSGQSPDIDLPTLSSVDSNSLQDNARRPVTLQCDKRPLGPLTLEGSVHIEGNMTHFVAEDLEYKIKLSSPQAKKCDTPPIPGSSSRSCTPSTLYRQLLVPQIGQIDNRLLNDLECEAQRIATSIDNLTENLCGILHSISSITADNVDVYKNAVSKMSDAMDANIKSMYTMMAKAEEVTQAMKLVQIHATRLKEIRRLVDLFDSCV